MASGLTDVALVRAVDAAFAGAADVTLAVQRVCRVVSEALGDPVIVRLLDDDDELELVGLHGPDQRAVDDIIRTAKLSAPPRVLADALRSETRRAFTIREIDGSEAMAVRSLGHRIRYRCGVVAPMRVREVAIGTLGLACTDPSHDHDTDGSVDLLADVADRCASHIDTARLEALVGREMDRPRLLAEGPQAGILRHSSDIVLVVSRSGRVVDVSPAITTVLGWEPAEVLNGPLFDLVDLSDRPRVAEQFRQATTTAGQTGTVEFRVAHRNRSDRWLEVRVNNLLEDPEVQALVITGRDVTDRHLASELVVAENELLQQIVGAAPLERVFESVCNVIEAGVGALAAAVWLREPDGVFALGAAPHLPDARRSGPDRWRFAPSEFVPAGLQDNILVIDPFGDPRWASWRRTAARMGIGGAWKRLVHDPDGQSIGAVTAYLSELRQPSEHDRQAIDLAAHLVGVALLQDRSSRAMAHAANHDSLTGLPNRAMFLDRLDRVLRRSGPDGCASVLFIDLDEFKLVNDSAGHAVGDRLLQRVADRLASVVRPLDLVARLGGDEFAVLCDGVGAEDACVLAARVLEGLDLPFDFDGRRFDVSASAGIAVGRGGTTADEVLRDADAAMYEAKRAGRSRYAVFTPAVRQAAMHRLGIERDLRTALERNALDVHYQPVIELGSGRLLGLEALVRWPGTTFPVPDVIEVAEASGLIGALGDRVLRHAVAQMASWRAAGLVRPYARVAVNVSARQLVDPEFPRLVQAVLAHYGVPGDALCLEVTESTMMTDVDGVTATMDELRAVGVSFAIDDFGTGHSSLSRLRTLGASVLKLDRSFIVDLDQGDEESVQMVASVVGLAHALGKELVVEGVERAGQLEILRRLGADAAQGYHLARPASAESIDAYLRSLPR